VTFLFWRLRTGACGVGACGFWRYRMPPIFFVAATKNFAAATKRFVDELNILLL